MRDLLIAGCGEGDRSPSFVVRWRAARAAILRYGVYAAPSPRKLLQQGPFPPHTIMRLPSHTATCSARELGAPASSIGTHWRRCLSYAAPVPTGSPVSSLPPHTRKYRPDQTIVCA